MKNKDLLQLQAISDTARAIIEETCSSSKEWLTTKEAAEVLHVPQKRVMKMVDDGVLIGLSGVVCTYVRKTQIQNRLDYSTEFRRKK